MTRAMRSATSMGLGAAMLVALAGSARAYDAGTTHAGLTQNAVLASSLSWRLAQLFALPSGLYETLRLEPADARGKALRERLGKLDAASGYAPDEGRLPAFAWVVAGSVVEEVPPWRARHHFIDPTSGRGLSQGGVWKGFSLGLASVASGVGSLRDLFAGEAFDGTGMAATEWLTSTENDLSLGRFLDARERATSARTAAARESALAEALLVAGALLHVIEDGADPARVHNDFRVALYDEDNAYDAFVAARYGRLAVPAPASPSPGAPRVVHLADLLHDKKGEGLADRTARRFYSAGLLSSSEGTTRPDALPPLVAGPDKRGYLTDQSHRHLARWERDAAGDPRWELDARCYSDAAEALLPEAGRAALAALEHLFRDPLSVAAEGDAAVVKNGALSLGAGVVTVLGEDDDGTRRVLSTRSVSSVAAGETLVALPEAPAGHRLAVVFRGVDASGEPLVTSVERSGAETEHAAP